MRIVAATLGVTLAVTAGACSSAPPETPAPEAALDHEATASQAAASSGPITRSQVIANAEEWVNAKLLYCQSPYDEPDPDTSCPHICDRQSDPEWNPYRSDCSGFVSWAWQLPAPGLVTSEFAPYETSASTAIPCTEMQPGDAANKDPSGHIVIFVKWVTPGKEAIFFEEPGCSADPDYAHEFQSAVTCSGNSVDIAYEGATFVAIRYVHIVDDPDAGADGGSGEKDSGGGKSDDAPSSGDAPDAHERGGKGGSSSGSGGGDGEDAGAGEPDTGAGPGSRTGTEAGAAAASANMDLGGTGTGCGVARGPSGSGTGALFAMIALAWRRRRHA